MLRKKYDLIEIEKSESAYVILQILSVDKNLFSAVQYNKKSLIFLSTLELNQKKG